MLVAEFSAVREATISVPELRNKLGPSLRPVPDTRQNHWQYRAMEAWREHGLIPSHWWFHNAEARLAFRLMFAVAAHSAAAWLPDRLAEAKSGRRERLAALLDDAHDIQRMTGLYAPDMARLGVDVKRLTARTREQVSWLESRLGARPVADEGDRDGAG